MPFFESNNTNINIDYTNCFPVSVIANYNAEGKIMPVYLSITDLYENVFKIKIDNVQSTKDGNGYKTYCCTIHNKYRSQLINLRFYTMEHLWVLEKANSIANHLF